MSDPDNQASVAESLENPPESEDAGDPNIATLPDGQRIQLDKDW